MTKKLIFLDIDGTLVGFDGKMPGSTKTALSRAVEAGHSLVISTGRLAAQVYPWLFDAARFDGFISSSGSNIKWKGKRVAGRFWSDKDIAAFRKTADPLGAAVFFHTERNLVAEPGAVEHQIEFFTKFGLPREKYASLLEHVIVADPFGLEIEKGIYIDSGKTLDEMRSLLGESFRVDGYSFGNIPPTSGEVTLSGVTKASAIDVLCEYLGVDISDTVAIGDGSNDIGMIKRAGLGIAMGNASDEVKAAADRVTDSIENDGLAKAIDKWIL